jgi:methyl-accepting chemotaxis protein
VHQGSQDTRERIEEIADAMREQSAATTDIAQNLERISVMSEKTNREVQNATITINQLEHLAEELKKEVSAFKV